MHEATARLMEKKSVLFSNKLNGAIVDAWHFDNNGNNYVNGSHNAAVLDGYYTNGVFDQGFVPNTNGLYLTNVPGFGTADFTLSARLRVTTLPLLVDEFTFMLNKAPGWFIWASSSEHYGTNRYYFSAGTLDANYHQYTLKSADISDTDFHYMAFSRFNVTNCSLTIDTNVISGSTTTDAFPGDWSIFCNPSWGSGQCVVYDDVQIALPASSWQAAGGQLPRAYSNAVQVATTNHFSRPACLLLDTTNTTPALLAFRGFESAGSQNLDCSQGTLRLWFQPSWNSGDLDAPTNGLLFNVGTNSATSGWWGLVITNNGTAIALNTQTNSASGLLATNNLLVTNLSFYSTNWYQIALNFDSTNTTLFTNGVLAGTGAPVTYWPSFLERTNGGFSIGSDLSGLNQARGRFDELDIHNNVKDTNWIYTNYLGVLMQ